MSGISRSASAVIRREPKQPFAFTGGSPLDFFNRTDLGFRVTDRFRKITKEILPYFDELDLDEFPKWRKLSDIRTIDVGKFMNFEDVLRTSFAPKDPLKEQIDMYWLEKCASLSPLQFANAIAAKYFGFHSRYLVPVGFASDPFASFWAVVIPEGIDQFTQFGRPLQYQLDAYPSTLLKVEPAGPIAADYHYCLDYDALCQTRMEKMSK